MASPIPIPTNPLFQDLTGRTFGRLTVVEYAGAVEYRYGTKRAKRQLWICRCSCGQSSRTDSRSLKSSHAKSCGNCGSGKRPRIRGPVRVVEKHGEGSTRKGVSAEYKVWQNMKARCYNSNVTRYHRYGGRGIKVCERWKDSFKNFLEDMGRRPSPRHTIERKDNDGDYEPQNCCWATKKTQSRNQVTNRLIEYRGEKKSLAEWGEVLGISAQRLCSRLHRGWSVERAFSTPQQPKRKQWVKARD